jgi:hypothetical protein
MAYGVLGLYKTKKMHGAHLAKSYSNGYLGSFGKRATFSQTCAFSFKRDISHITLIKEISANSILTSSGSFFHLLPWHFCVAYIIDSVAYIRGCFKIS